MMESVWMLYISLAVCAGTMNILPQNPGLILSQTSINFIYYPDKLAWNAARSLCQSMGGDLAKIDSKETLDYIVWRAQENYGRNIFDEEYWIGLVQLEENVQFWVADCTNLTFTDYSIERYNPDKHCFRHTRDHDVDRRECFEEEAVLCQVPSPQPCEIISRVDGEILTDESGITDCDSSCIYDPKCWAAVQFAPYSCIKLAIPGHGNEKFSLGTKFCFNVTLNQSKLNSRLYHSGEILDATCGNFTVLPSTTKLSSETTTEILTTTTKEIFATAVVGGLTSYTTEVFSVTVTKILTETTTIMLTETATKTLIATKTISDGSLAMGNSSDTITSPIIATNTQNIASDTPEKVAAKIVINLTIDSKSTSSHIRGLISAEDKRLSSKFVGCIGIILVIAPLALMVINDVKKMLHDFRSHDNIFKKM